ncbi:MAG: mechanosensitive ion channel [Ruminococcaceae bacterium]|nr:mechanosensitive ion channel [Oscillospiraceae bacterium]
MNNFLNASSQSLADLIKEKDFEGISAYILAKAPSFIAAAIIVVIGYILSKLIGKLVVKAMRAKGVDSSIHSFIRTIVMFVINLVFVLSALSTLNIDVNSFITALGAAGVTAGIGLQASISQFASGIQILVNHPFKSGDFIDIGSVSGKVQEIKMMYTVLVTLDNKRVIIPNSTITSSNIINYNAENRRRLDLVFSVSYDADISKAKEVLLDVVKENNLILTNPEPLIAVKEHAASSVNIACLVWCNSNDYWDIYYYMQESVKNAFDKHGIPIPYGQLDIHVKKD